MTDQPQEKSPRDYIAERHSRIAQGIAARVVNLGLDGTQAHRDRGVLLDMTEPKNADKAQEDRDTSHTHALRSFFQFAGIDTDGMDDQTMENEIVAALKAVGQPLAVSFRDQLALAFTAAGAVLGSDQNPSTLAPFVTKVGDLIGTEPIEDQVFDIAAFRDALVEAASEPNKEG